MRRFFEILLVGYALFLGFYLMLRFLLKAEWAWLDSLHIVAPYLFLPILLGFLLALLMGARRIAGIYLLLILGGLLWFVPILLPKAQATPDENSLRVISFNIFMGNRQIENATNWLLEQDADIIFLQEVPSELPALEAAYPHVEYTFGSKSLALFSRYPISLSSEFNLQGLSQQRFILDVDGQNIALYNIHLIMPLGGRDGDFLLLRYDESVRNQQIVDLLDTLEAETLPVIVAGDFNLSEWSPIYSQLAAQLQDSYRQASWGLGVTWPAGESEEIADFLPRLFRLDYLWHSAEIQAVSASVGIALGSDHLPLIVELNLPTE